MLHTIWLSSIFRNFISVFVASDMTPTSSWLPLSCIHFSCTRHVHRYEKRYSNSVKLPTAVFFNLLWQLNACTAAWRSHCVRQCRKHAEHFEHLPAHDAYTNTYIHYTLTGRGKRDGRTDISMREMPYGGGYGPVTGAVMLDKAIKLFQ